MNNYPYLLTARRDEADPTIVHRQLEVVTNPDMLPKAPPPELPPALEWLLDDLRRLAGGTD